MTAAACLALGAMLAATTLQAQPSVTTNAAGVLVLTNHFGDLNNDGQVDVRDVVLLTHHLTGTRLLSTQMVARADLNLDGAVNDTDRRILADMIAARNTGSNDDFDNDELPNADEIRLGTNPFNPDTDGDGWLDGWEVVDGTDPLDPLSHLPTTIVARPPVRVSLPAASGGEEIGAIVVARPAVRVTDPPLPEAETNAPGTVLARPPVRVIYPR